MGHSEKVLVVADNCCRISDFGILSDIRNYDVIEKNQKIFVLRKRVKFLISNFILCLNYLH